MNREETNIFLLSELAKWKQNKELSDELKHLFYQLCRTNIEIEKYKLIDDEIKYNCVINAYQACVKFAIRFNQEKSDNAYGYLNQIIRSDFAKTLKI